MKKLILLIFFFPLYLWSVTYDVSMLHIGAKLFPKIILMEQGTKERIHSTLSLIIVTDSTHKEHAKRLLNILEAQKDNSTNTTPLKLRVISPKEALEITDAHGFIVLINEEDYLLEGLIKHANKNKILTFSFDPNLLGKGVSVSLYIGKNVKPYLNLTALKEVPFTFEYGFLKLSQPYLSVE